MNFIRLACSSQHELKFYNKKLEEQKIITLKNHTFIPRDLFFCHRSLNGAIVNGILEIMERGSTYPYVKSRSCWISHRNLIKVSSTDYPKKLTKGIESCKVFFFIMTKESVVSKDVIYEITEARRLSKKIVIV